MVADDLVVKTHGGENLTMYLLMLAHVVKKFHGSNYNYCITLLLPALIRLFLLFNILIC